MLLWFFIGGSLDLFVFDLWIFPAGSETKTPLFGFFRLPASLIFSFSLSKSSPPSALLWIIFIFISDLFFSFQREAFFYRLRELSKLSVIEDWIVGAHAERLQQTPPDMERMKCMKQKEYPWCGCTSAWAVLRKCGRRAAGRVRSTFAGAGMGVCHCYFSGLF